MSVTLHDVARYANVSTATVSRAINFPEKVSEETLKTIRTAIKAVNYIPNLNARNLKKGINHTIGFVVPDITNLMYASVIINLEQKLYKKNLSLLIVNTSEDLQKEKIQLKSLAERNIGLLVFASTAENYSLVKDDVPLVPVILFDRDLPGSPFHRAYVSSWNAYYSATSSLLAAGHRNIMMICGIPRLSTTVERKDAFRKAFTDYGLEDPSNQIFHSDMTYSNIENIMELCLKKGCTAIVCGNRKITSFVACCICSKGMKIGKDIEMVGTTDSTIAVPFENDINRISKSTEEMTELLYEAILDCVGKKKSSFSNDLITQAVYLPRTQTTDKNR